MGEDDTPDPARAALHAYLTDRLVEVDLQARYYSWVHALDRDVRGLPLDAADDYDLDGADLRTAWTEQGFVATGRGKAIQGRLDVTEGGLRFTSTRYGLRGTNFLELTLNLTRRRVMVGTMLHVLAAEQLERTGRPLPDPPYTRPWAYGPGDVHWYVARVAELVRDLAEVCAQTPYAD